ncbi:unnamed protein product, partial [Rotaria sordida]
YYPSISSETNKFNQNGFVQQRQLLLKLITLLYYFNIINIVNQNGFVQQCQLLLKLLHYRVASTQLTVTQQQEARRA